MKTALTIAGSDPTGGAGFQSDLKTFHACGVYGISAVAALTAQNTTTVSAIQAVSQDFLKKQLDTLISDIRPDALKTGMLYTIGAILAVADAVQGYELANLVIDPVTVSSTGASLIENGGLEILKLKLFPLARVVTPNIYEATALTGVVITSPADMEQAARELRKLGPETVIITGGHLDNETVDLVYDGTAFHRITGKKLAGEYHGTGCTFSAALAAHLALGSSVVHSAEKAHEFVHHSIRHAYALGQGMKLLHV
jgi:hydroxymethylpyrimidine/phosphomethylpyrimidine kinase